MKINKQALVIIGTLTAIDFISDVTLYSIGASKGGKLKIRFPEGKEILKIVALGVVSGIIVDFVTKKLEAYMSTREELQLSKLEEIEKEKLASGQNKGLVPTSIVWKGQHRLSCGPLCAKTSDAWEVFPYVGRRPE